MSYYIGNILDIEKSIYVKKSISTKSLVGSILLLPKLDSSKECNIPKGKLFNKEIIKWTISMKDY